MLKVKSMLAYNPYLNYSLQLWRLDFRGIEVCRRKTCIQVQDPLLGGMASFRATLLTWAKDAVVRPGQSQILEEMGLWVAGEGQAREARGRANSCPGIM